MSNLEPDDSRDVTGSQTPAPGEPPRTGPREDEARERAKKDGVTPVEPHPDGTQVPTEGDATGDRWHRKATEGCAD